MHTKPRFPIFFFFSQVCLLLEDTDFDSGAQYGKMGASGVFAGSLRRFLMKEHLGLLADDKGSATVNDPTSDAFFHGVWNATAKKNTQRYDEAFLVVPTDNVRTLEETNNYEQLTPLAEFDRMAAAKILKGVKVRTERDSYLQILLLGDIFSDIMRKNQGHYL